MRTTLVLLTALAFSTLTAVPASATFHLMQIEQVMGGVDGNTNVQAVQLRMRTSFQNALSPSRLVVRNASGASPVVLFDFTTSVANHGAGVRVLVATSNLSSFTNPPLSPDFVLTNTIPVSYQTAGSLTFEDDFGGVYWRLSWGGPSYTGSGSGLLDNDADGNFNPPFGGPLPSSSGRALLFTGSATALSTNNAADYQVTSGNATFTRNNGSSGTIVSTVGVEESWPSLALGAPYPNPARGAVSYSVTLPRSARVRVEVLDLAGRRVGTLVDEPLSAGRHWLEWEVVEHRALPSGVYLLRLEADGERRSRRVALIR